MYPWYPDLLFFHVYGPVDRYEEIVRKVRERTSAEIELKGSIMKRRPRIRYGVLAVLLGQVLFLKEQGKAEGLDVDEVLNASIFSGTTIGTSAGNPDTDGQAWYQANCSTFMKYYETPARWGKSEIPGTYPAYLTYSVVTLDLTEGVPEGSLKTSDQNSKSGVAWVYRPPVGGRYQLVVDRMYAYANGGGNPQTWKVSVYRNSSWQDLVSLQSLGSKTAAYGPGTNVVAELTADEKIAFVVKTGGTAYNGGSSRIEGLRVRRLPGPGTIVTIR